MSEWKTVRLGDYITEYSVKNKSNEDIPVYSVTNTQGFCTEYFSKDVSSKDKSNYKIVPRGCFAYNPSRINVGSVDWQRYEDRVIVSPLYNVFKVSPELENQYLYYFLKSDIGHTLITSKAEGSVRDNLKITMLAEFSIPLPHLEEQKHIAAMLDKCTALVTKYKLMLEKYDTLIKSRFIEMFGDPVQNPKGWKKTELGNLCKEVRYGTSKPASENGKYTYLRMNNITYEGELDLTNIKSIDISEDELPKCSVRKGDVLFNRTNSIELCGKTCLYKLDKTMVIAGYIIRVRVSEKLNPQYVSTLFNTKSIKKLLREMAKGAVNQANINAQEMQSIQIPVPPISLQNEYESFVQQIDKSKFAVQKSLEKTETLYKSLMQRYFA